ncbi:hypothetical protein EDB87DRAFT_1678943 [Lactarius vividus]|nr:hypothetical protein EDB87DRAFT_1678943 [Lactarius vividus]
MAGHSGSPNCFPGRHQSSCFSTVYSTVHSTVFSASRFVRGFSIETSADSTHPHSDVYSYNFPKDPRPVKFLAYFVFVLETVQTALTGADIYYWFVAKLGDVERLGNSYFFPIDVPIMAGISSLIIIVVAAVTQAAAATWLGIASLTVKKYAVSKTAVYVRIFVSVGVAMPSHPLSCWLWSIASAMADILTTVAITLLLRRASGKFSNFVLIRVIRLTVEINTLIASAAVTTLVLYVAFPNELYYAYTVGILGKLYSNTLLVSLNNRIYLREHNHLDMMMALTSRSPIEFALPHSHCPVLLSESLYLGHSRGHQQVELPITHTRYHVPTLLNGSGQVRLATLRDLFRDAIAFLSHTLFRPIFVVVKVDSRNRRERGNVTKERTNAPTYQ